MRGLQVVFAGLVLSVFVTEMAQASMVSVYGALHGQNRALRFGTTSASIANRGFGDVFDLGVDEFAARGSVASGTLRVLAREGGIPRPGSSTGAVAGVSMRETITLTGPPAPRSVITIGYSVSATPDTLLGLTGHGQGYGHARAEVFGDFGVEYDFLGTTGRRTERGSARFSHVSGHDFRPHWPSGSGHTVTEAGPFLTSQDSITSDRSHLPIERILDVRRNVVASAVSIFEMTFEVDLLAGPGDALTLFANLEADVDGTTGTYAALNALHSGQFSVSLPNGLGFTSESGVFLTAPVPLPPGIVLMLSALAGLSVMRRSRVRLTRTGGQLSIAPGSTTAPMELRLRPEYVGVE